MNDDFSIKIKEQSKWSVRTDLAYDVVTRTQDDIPGLIQKTEEISNVIIYKNVITEEAQQVIGKKKGTYYTIDLSNVDFHDSKLCENVESAVAQILNRMLINLNLKNKKCLLVGLGNINVTPDALGPYVMDNVVVTRHLFKMGKPWHLAFS